MREECVDGRYPDYDNAINLRDTNMREQDVVRTMSVNDATARGFMQAIG